MQGAGSSGPVGAAVLATDTTGTITHWNRYAEALFGWSAAEAIGRKIREVVEGSLDPRPVREAADHLRTGASWEGEARIRKTDGTLTLCRLTLFPLTGTRGTAVGMVGVAIDIGEQTRVKRRQAAEHAVTRVLAEVEDLRAAAGRIIEAVCRSLDWEAGAVWYVDPSTDTIRCADLWRDERADAAEFEVLTRQGAFHRGVGLPGRVWADGEPAWIRDVTRDDNFPRAPAAEAAGLHAAFGFPIRLAGRVLGMFEFFSREIQEPDDRLLETMDVLGSQIGQFIERRTAQSGVEHSESLKSAMLEAALDCIISMDAQGRIIEFNPAAERTFGYRREEVLGRPVADAIIPPSLRERHWRGYARHLATGRSAILGQRLELTGMRKDGAEFPVELTVTRVDLPGPPVFTAYLRDITTRKEADEAVSRLLAAQLEARAEGESQRRRLAFLAEASQALAGSLDHHRTLRRLADLAVARVADWCIVYLQDENGEIERVTIRAADPARAEVAGHLEDYRLVPGAPGVPTVIREGRPEFHPQADAALLAADVDDPDGLRRDLEPLGITSWICVPLTARGRTFGAVSFVSAESGRTYGEDDLALAEDLAQRAAQAIDNARLYETQRSVARTLQEGLLPPELPEIPGIELAARYRPAAGGAEVGGDFYDAFELGEGRWAIVVGDVCGKGVEAAALTGLVRHTIRALAPRQEPSSALLGVNDSILRQKSDEFCTLAYAEVEKGGGPTRVRVCLAGHPLPFHIRAGGRVELVGEPGTPLGLFPDPALRWDEVLLEPGESLVLYTDGVIEEQARRGEGAEGLIARLAGCGGCDAPTIAHTIEAWVAETGAASPRDDMAVLVVRCSS
ncbi:MAG: PAS domain S-box protein [Acidimicrobiia bacterium]